MSESLSDEAVSLCIRVGVPAKLCQELIALLGSVETAEAFIKVTAAQDDVGLPTTQERHLLMVGDPDRGERIRKSLDIAMLGGGMPIGFGIPSPHQDMLMAQERLARQDQELGPHLRFGDLATLKRRLSHLDVRQPLPDPPASRSSRSLPEKKARRAKRKQRRDR